MEPVCDTCERESCGCGRESVTMNARVLRVNCCDLLVCDLCTCQEVLVHTNDACCFRPGQCVRIEYSGAMTMSIPPQINADSIQCVPCGGCCC